MQLNTSEACALGILGGESKLTDGVVDVRFRHLTGLGEGITKTALMAALARRLGKVAPQGRFSGVSRMVVMLKFLVTSIGHYTYRTTFQYQLVFHYLLECPLAGEGESISQPG